MTLSWQPSLALGLEVDHPHPGFISASLLTAVAIQLSSKSTELVMRKCCALVVRNVNIKSTKTLLEEHGLLSHDQKIRPGVPQRSIIPTTIECPGQANISLRDSFLSSIAALSQTLVSEMDDVVEDVIVLDPPDQGSKQRNTSILEASMLQALQRLRPTLLPCPARELVSLLPSSYSIYSPMLLLPFHFFRHPHWQSLLSNLAIFNDQGAAFFASVAEKMHVTNIAINAIIPADNAPTSDGNATENILRSPSNLQVVHGDFGPEHPAYPQYRPQSEDYDEAFWVSTKQNGIHQTWAPRYTMFSAGNVTEKARLLTLSSVTETVKVGRETGRGCTAVDLFSGIGYFAFSYVRAGFDKVLCWDLNPWSIEGLRRGAAANKWHSVVLDFELDAELEGNQEEHAAAAACRPSVQLLAFRESNEVASRRISHLRSMVPPIRHVNCGTLPDTGQAWRTAVHALDPELGGWIHLHETVAQSEMKQRADYYKDLVAQHARLIRPEVEVGVELEHIEIVKSMGPRLLHVVFDIGISYGSHDA